MIKFVKSAPASVWLEHLSSSCEMAVEHLDSYAITGDDADLVACHRHLNTCLRAARQAQLQMLRDHSFANVNITLPLV